MNSFWEGGANELISALKKEQNEKIKTITESSMTPDEKNQEIKNTKLEFHLKLKDAKASLF